MNKRFLKFLSIFVVFFFSGSMVFSPIGFAEKPCWNDGKLDKGAGGVDGDTGDSPSGINEHNITEDAEPVDVGTGNFSYQNQDLFIPSRGLSLEIKRFYSALDGYEGPFGVGWNHSYNIFLLEVSDGDQIYIIRRNANGSKDEFLKNPDGSYESVSGGCYDTLTEEPNGYLIQNKYGLSHKFNLDGMLVSITDRNQNKITLEYDSGTGVLTKVTDSLGRSVNFIYNDQHKVTQIMDFIGRTTSYGYDHENNLVSVTTPSTEEYPFGLTSTYTYDDQHRLTSITDAKGQTYLSMVYDENGRVKEQTYGYGTFYFTYEDNMTTLIDRKGYKTEYKLNDNGTVESIRKYTNFLREGEPAYYETRYEYNDKRERTKVIYPKGNWVKYTYDDRGNLLGTRKKKIDSPDIDNPVNDIVTTFTYEPRFNFVKTVTDPKGNVTTYTYDYELEPDDPNCGTFGNLIKITYPEVNVVIPEGRFTYNQYSQIETITNSEGKVTKYTYYPDTGYLKEVISDYGEGGFNYKSEMIYNEVGNVVSVKDPLQRETFFQYNALNKLTQTITPEPFSYRVKFLYDEGGFLKEVKCQADDIGITWQDLIFTYDKTHRFRNILDNLGNTTTYNYDLNENKTSVTDAEGKTLDYLYDERSLPWKIIQYNNNQELITEYTYDANGNLKEIKDAKGNLTTYTYDDFDRLIVVIYDDATMEEYTYNENSNLITHTNRECQTTTYDYDELNRLVSEICPDSSTIQYQYDIAGRLTDITDARGTIHYDYDALNRVTSVDYGQWTVDYSYNAVGNLTKLFYPDGTYITYSYDGLNRLTSIRDQSGADIATYTYDALSRRTQLDLANNTQTIYQYDSINRLLNMVNKINNGEDISTFAYTYNKVGNRTSMVVNGTDTYTYTYDDIYQLIQVTSPTSQVTSYDYDELGNRITVDDGVNVTSYTSNNLNQYTDVNGIAYFYDDNGNLTDDGVWNYTYDYKNRIISATDGTIITANYTYDALGRRIKKEVTIDPQTSSTNFLYDGAQVIAEYDENDNLLRKYIYGPGIDELILMKEAEDTYYYHFNNLGSATNITNSSAEIVEENNYDVFGKIDKESEINNPYYFTGRRYDPETGLYYYRARYYSPDLGRFLEVDPLGYGDSLNLYSYCANDPVNTIDPLGLALILVGQRRIATEEGYELSIAAKTWKKEHTGHHEIVPVSTGQAAIEAMKAYAEKYGSIDNLQAFAHSGGKGIYFFQGPGACSLYIEMPEKALEGAATISQIEASWFAPDADVKIWGCNTTEGGHDSIVKRLADQINLNVDGCPGPVTYSGVPNGKDRQGLPASVPEDYKGPVYMVPGYPNWGPYINVRPDVGQVSQQPLETSIWR